MIAPNVDEANERHRGRAGTVLPAILNWSQADDREDAAVVDVAMLVKLFQPEALSDQVGAFFSHAATTGRAVLVCPSARIEAANILHTRARHEEITLAEADAALRLLDDLGVIPYEPPRFATAVAAFAREHRLRSLHHAQAVVLAQAIGCECWTGHQALYNAIAAKVPWLRWIGDYETVSRADDTGNWTDTR